jgi:2-polyprenyl-6-hydroxyphenyl methylase/3-demethylubiquinone-9 3-methyltransferase
LYAQGHGEATTHCVPCDRPYGRPDCRSSRERKTALICPFEGRIPCIGLNGGPAIKHNWAFSFQVATADQAETDRYWNAIVGNGGEESACGWCTDKWGLSWQITPIALTKAITDPDTAAAKRAFDAMMQMKKIAIAALQAAHHG